MMQLREFCDNLQLLYDVTTRVLRHFVRVPGRRATSSFMRLLALTQQQRHHNECTSSVVSSPWRETRLARMQSRLTRPAPISRPAFCCGRILLLFFVRWRIEHELFLLQRQPCPVVVTDCTFVFEIVICTVETRIRRRG